MSFQWLFNIYSNIHIYIYIYILIYISLYMDGAVQELNIGVLGKGLELPSATGGRFEINPLRHLLGSHCIRHRCTREGGGLTLFLAYFSHKSSYP